MKTKITSIFFTALAVLTVNSHAALIVQYSLDNATAAATLEARDWADNVAPSLMAPSNSAITRSGAFLNYRGWGQTLNLANYVSFVIAAEPGYQMNLSSFSFDTASSSSSTRATSYVWAMRVDNGSGFGEWQFDQTYSVGNLDFSSINNVKTWDFADLSTTGSVEFALFGTAGDTARSIEITRNGMTLDGTVTPAAVPEPSAVLLGSIGSLALLRRRRR